MTEVSLAEVAEITSADHVSRRPGLTGFVHDAPIRFTAHDLPRETLRALMTRADRPALWRAAGHLGALVLTGGLLWRLRATAWPVPLLFVHGYVLAFLFCAFHETAHRTAFRTRWLNTVLGTLAGLLIVWPYRNYRVYHWERHRFTQDEARDPELFFPKPASPAAYPLMLTGVPNLVRRLTDLLRLACGRADRPWMSAAEGRRPHRRGARVPRGLRRGRGGLGAGPLDSRAGRAWNMPYHAEHHAYPAVPFHALPSLHRHVVERLATGEPGYIAATRTVNRHLLARRGGRAGILWQPP